MTSDSLFEAGLGSYAVDDVELQLYIDIKLPLFLLYPLSSMIDRALQFHVGPPGPGSSTSTTSGNR